jgi:hypothetical protein
VRSHIVDVRYESMYLQRMRLIQCICGSLLAFGVTGCLSAAGMVQTAQTVGKGGYEVSLDPGVNGYFTVPAAYPMFHVAFRYGVTDRVDLGARLGNSFAELQTKFLLTDPANETIAVSLAPAAGALFTLGFNGANIFLPLLIGFKFGPHELTLGPRLQNSFIFAPDLSADSRFNSFGTGLSIGFAAQVSEKFRILPEFSILKPLAVTPLGGQGSLDGSPIVAETFIFAGNVGFQIGSPRKKFTTTPVTEL